MLNCPIKNILSSFVAPSGNPGRDFPLESPCPSPEQPTPVYCPLLLEDSSIDAILLNDGQPIILNCIQQLVNAITITASYRSCPLQIEYYINSDYNVDSDIIISFVNVLSTSSGPSLSYTVNTVLQENTSLAFYTLSALIPYGNLTQSSVFVNNSATPINPSASTYLMNFYSVFENLTSCSIGVEQNTPGFTMDGLAMCTNIVITEQTTGLSSIYAPCSAYAN